MKIHRHLPILGRIYATRDQALRQLAAATALRAETLTALDSLRLDRDNAILERDRALSANAALMAEAALMREKLQRLHRETGRQDDDGFLKYRTRPFIVIMAVGRSGSTLLQGVLNAMPGLLVRGENGGFLLPLLHCYEALCFAKNHASSFTTPVNAWFGCEELDPDALLVDFARITAAQLLGSRRHVDQAAIGFKEIRWLQRELGTTSMWAYLDFIQSLFGDTRFILLTRDADELLQSGWWPVVATDATRRDIAQFYALARTAQARSLFEIDYAELHQGSGAVRRLAEFVGSKYTPDIDQVFAARHSYDMSESNLREREIARLRAMLDSQPR